jgi:uncharacterized membrane protein
MNIDGLKTLMDEFDPAALLPELDTLLGKMEFIARLAVLAGPVLLLVMGLAYLLIAPKEANYHFGYRCFFGMGSVEAWRYTQRLAGAVWTGLGGILTLIMLIVSGSFGGKEIMDMIWAGAKCVIWEAVLVAISCLFINTMAAFYFDARGERRQTPKKLEKER